MNREIKFRAWAGGVMVYFDLWNVDRHSHGITRIESPHTSVSKYNETIMQYTGLKDKSGKEIYEGDIVECEYYPDLPTTKDIPLTWRGYVRWGEFDACFHVHRPGVEHFQTYAVNYSGSAVKRWEIIGNIYENPELLNEVKP